ncbi:hypothetical protein, partial [Vannielia sp.]|uniref:hypothetical protein n=1 Tax=Vannielia sp. TaxID=2813045 RepID=UPI00262AD4AB
IRRADHAAGGQAGVAALRGIFIAHHEEGRDKGLAQPLEIAIALSRQSLARATDADERGTLQNDLATALQTLGERESGTERLEQAVTAYRVALKEWTRERVPLEWAMTQMNLGNALAILGERESGTERLEQAVTAFRAALKERTRDRVPLNWAGTQGNLANVEIAYFEKTGDPTHLTAARTHAEAALEVFTEAGATQYIGMAENILARITALETS